MSKKCSLFSAILIALGYSAGGVIMAISVVSWFTPRPHLPEKPVSLEGISVKILPDKFLGSGIQVYLITVTNEFGMCEEYRAMTYCGQPMEFRPK